MTTYGDPTGGQVDLNGASDWKPYPFDSDPLALPGDPAAAWGDTSLVGHAPGPFADFAGLVRELANHNVAHIMSMISWAELKEEDQQLADLRARLSIQATGAFCNNRAGYVRELGKLAVAARQSLDHGLTLAGMDDKTFGGLPNEIQRIAARAADMTEQEVQLLELLRYCREESLRQESWIERAKAEQCYRDYTPLWDSMTDAISQGRRWAPESHVQSMDYHGRKLVAMCKVSESGVMRTYITEVFQRRAMVNRRPQGSRNVISRLLRREEEEDY